MWLNMIPWFQVRLNFKSRNVYLCDSFYYELESMLYSQLPVNRCSYPYKFIFKKIISELFLFHVGVERFKNVPFAMDPTKRCVIVSRRNGDKKIVLKKSFSNHWAMKRALLFYYYPV